MTEATISTPTARSEWRGGWPIVLAAAIGNILPSIPPYSIGLFVLPLQSAFGWSRADVSAPILITSIAMTLMGPFAGRLTDRYGPRRVGLVGIVFFCLSLIAVGFSGPRLASWYLAWSLYGVAQVFAGAIVWTAAVVRRFAAARGLALAVALSGTGLAGTIIPPLTMHMIEAYGWRGAFWALAAVSALVFPVIFLLFRDPSATGPRVSDGTPAAEVSRSGDQDLSLAHAMRTSRFWRLALSAAAVALGLSLLLVHMVPILIGSGMAKDRAVMIVSLIGPTSIAGRLLGGYLVDRVFAPWFGGAVFLLNAVACLMLAHFNGSLSQAVAISLFTGIGLGVDLNLVGYLVSRYFGARAFPSIYGLLMGLYGLGFGGGALLGGWFYDRIGSYGLLLQILSGVLAVGALLIATLGRYPQTAVRDGDAASLQADRTQQPASARVSHH